MLESRGAAQKSEFALTGEPQAVIREPPEPAGESRYRPTAPMFLARHCDRHLGSGGFSDTESAPFRILGGSHAAVDAVFCRTARSEPSLAAAATICRIAGPR